MGRKNDYQLFFSHKSPWLGLLPQNAVVPLAALVARKHDGRNFYPKTNNYNFFICKKVFFTIRYVKQGHPLVEKTQQHQFDKSDLDCTDLYCNMSHNFWTKFRKIGHSG